jgi:hypothetical protein
MTAHSRPPMFRKSLRYLSNPGPFTPYASPPDWLNPLSTPQLRTKLALAKFESLLAAMPSSTRFGRSNSLAVTIGSNRTSDSRLQRMAAKSSFCSVLRMSESRGIASWAGNILVASRIVVVAGHIATCTIVDRHRFTIAACWAGSKESLRVKARMFVTTN